MMAVFLATSFPGNFLAGWLGKFYSEMNNVDFFLMVAAIAAAPAPIIWAFNNPLKKIMQQRSEPYLKEDCPDANESNPATETSLTRSPLPQAG